MSGAIARQLVRHQSVRFTALSLQQPAKEAFRCSPIPSWLHEDVDHVAILVDGAPKILTLALDPHEELVEVPRVAQPAFSTPQPAGVLATELPAPLTDGFVGDRNPALRQQILHVAKAQAEPVVQPDGVADDLWWKPVAPVARCDGVHGPTLAPIGST